MRQESRKLLASISKDAAPEFAKLVASAYNDRKLFSDLHAVSNFAGYESEKPVPVAHHAFVENKYSDFCDRCGIRAIEMANFYYTGIDYTCFSKRPFEIFILNEYFHEIVGGSGNYTRNMLLDDVTSWSPFLKELIIDTCNFVLRGRRDIDIVMLRTMAIDYANALDKDIEPSFPELNVKQRFEWSEIENMSSKEFFTRWVSQRRGIEDMLCAHQIMLGV